MPFKCVVLDLVEVGSGNHRADRQLGSAGEARQAAGNGEEAQGQGLAQGKTGYGHDKISGVAQKR
ncbi:hypothetical protein D3C81_2137790 [compost metagenome]